MLARLDEATDLRHCIEFMKAQIQSFSLPSSIFVRDRRCGMAGQIKQDLHLRHFSPQTRHHRLVLAL